MSLQTLARAGVTLAGSLVAVDGERVAFDDSAPANMAAGGTALASRIRTMLDEVIARAGRHAPPVEPDDADRPVQLDPPPAVNLRASGISAVVWCTGYTGDFTWLDPVLADDDGWPKHCDGAAPTRGLWYV